jgi:hypothetical protein
MNGVTDNGLHGVLVLFNNMYVFLLSPHVYQAAFSAV